MKRLPPGDNSCLTRQIGYVKIIETLISEPLPFRVNTDPIEDEMAVADYITGEVQQYETVLAHLNLKKVHASKRMLTREHLVKLSK